MKTKFLNLEFCGELTWFSIQDHFEKKIEELKFFFNSFQIDQDVKVEINFDFEKVTRVDMSAISLVIEIKKKIKLFENKESQVNVSCVNVPSDLNALGDLCGMTNDLDFL